MTPLRVTGFAIGALGAVVAALTVGSRFGSPWPLEWMEGASLHHALRLSQGLPLYAAPNAEFVPYVYPPLAYVPMAAGVWLFGPQLWVGRLVSLLAFAGSLVCVGRTVARATSSVAAGCGAAGVLALGFGYTGAFLDLVRVDSVFLFLVLLGLERLSARSFATGLALLVLSCFAKQHGVLFLVAAWIGLCLERVPARGAMAASAVALATGVGLLEAVSGGWFLRYTWSLPGAHGLEPHLLFTYFGVDVLLYLPVLALFAGLRLLRRDGALSTSWAVWLAAGLAASALGRAHPGGDDNVRLPGFALLVLTGSIAWSELCTRVRSNRGGWVASAAFALQALWLLQLPAAHAPAPQQAHAFQSLTTALRRCAGGELRRTVALDHALLTGTPFVHTMALSDVFLASDRELATRATRALAEALAAPDAPASLAVSATFPELQRAIDANYTRCSELPAMRLPTGYALGPTRVYRRNDIQLADAGLLWR